MSENVPETTEHEPGNIEGVPGNTQDGPGKFGETGDAAKTLRGKPENAKDEPGKIEDEEGFTGTDGANPLDGGQSVDLPRPADRPGGRLRRAFAELRGTRVLGPIKADSDQAIRLARGRQENSLRGVYGTVLLIAMCGQVAFADYFLIRYGDEMKWQLPEAVVLAFFTSVVVEVIGLVLVVTTSLFPTVDKATSADGR